MYLQRTPPANPNTSSPSFQSEVPSPNACTCPENSEYRGEKWHSVHNSLELTNAQDLADARGRRIISFPLDNIHTIETKGFYL